MHPHPCVPDNDFAGGAFDSQMEGVFPECPDRHIPGKKFRNGLCHLIVWDFPIAEVDFGVVHEKIILSHAERTQGAGESFKADVAVCNDLE